MRRLLLILATMALLAACSETKVVYVTPEPTTNGGGITIPGASSGPSAAPTQAPSGPVTQADLVAATVQIFGYENASDPTDSPIYAGSGTILTADGYILTNSHVAAPDAPGLAVQYQSPGDGPVGKLVIALNEAEDKAPVKTYIAKLVAVDGYLDVAVVKIDTTVDGEPVDTASLNLPHLALGDSDAAHIGDPVSVIGFPNIGGDTITVAKGDVSGFISDDRLGDRAWIKTSAIVYHGNSGGLASNAAGEILAIPTRLPDFGHGQDVGGFSLLRPINLAKPVIEAALNGQEYLASKYVEMGTGQERMNLVGWLDPADDSCNSADPTRGLPVGVTRMAVAFAYDGFTNNEDYLTAWTYQSQGQTTVLTKTARLWDAGPSGDCFVLDLSYADGFPENTYGLVVFAGPTLRAVAEAETTTGAAPQPTQPPANNGGDMVTISGRMVNANNGKPINGAIIWALLPGTDVQAWAKAGGSSDKVASTGITGTDGTFVMVPDLEVGVEYPFVVVADGYKPIVADVTPDANGAWGDIGMAPK